MSSSTPGTITLKPGREKPVVHRHPWIFTGAVQHLPDDVADGGIVDVTDSRGTWLARGYLNRASQICVRLLTWNEAEPIDATFWRSKLTTAVAGRAALQAAGHTCYRLVHAESDYLPGLTVDRYGDYLVLQAGTLTIDQHKQELANTLLALTGCHGVVERSDIAARKHEGLPPAAGVLAGHAPDGPVQVLEHGLHFQVDMVSGQKTGFYPDQRENRRRVAAYCRDGRVLNAFSYTGAFGIYALAAGARFVVNLDASVSALEAAEQTLAANGFDVDAVSEQLAGDVFQVLRDWQALDTPETRFDVIVLDPPKFAHNRRGVERALRGYKEINLLALRLLKPGGTLATFSCSGLVSAELFQKVVFGAAVDAGRDVQVLEWLHQGSDHPVAITFPEGEYLKGLICRVL